MALTAAQMAIADTKPHASWDEGPDEGISPGTRPWRFFCMQAGPGSSKEKNHFVHKDTLFDADALSAHWNRYYTDVFGHFVSIKSGIGPQDIQARVIQSLKTARKATVDCQWKQDTELWDMRSGMTKVSWDSTCRPIISRWSRAIKEYNHGHGECEWDRRLDPMNHSPLLPAAVPWMEDSAPLMHTKPGNAAAYSRTESHKAGGNAAKFSIRATVGTCLPVAEAGLFMPKIYDGHISQVSG